LLGLFGYALFARRITPMGVFAIALYFSGGVSNLADRWAYGGYVVDFINLGLGPLRSGIFNVADIFIMAGALILVANALHSRRNDF
jgi:signal peptidase II